MSAGTTARRQTQTAALPTQCKDNPLRRTAYRPIHFSLPHPYGGRHATRPPEDFGKKYSSRRPLTQHTNKNGAAHG